ncbi:MAG: HAD hydrolase family protein [Oscillospiraceae bacterium]|nr:HAD hydrolase family protein [Oscillospiraceae bacterium]
MSGKTIIQKNRRQIPLPGQRILRSLISILLCFAVYALRGRRGMPFYSVIAALQCLQPYHKSMNLVAKRRVAGTFVGAAWGLVTLLIELRITQNNVPEEMLHYLIISLITAVVLYSTVLLDLKDASYFSAVVFLSITINHIGDVNPYRFVYHRTMDTLIGVAVAELVNRLHLPRTRNRDTLFVSGIHNTIFGMGQKISGYAKVELNRLIEDGCLFTVSTIQTPATVRELLPEVDIRLPVIAADGTLLYDMNKREILDAVYLDPGTVCRLCAFLDEREVEYFVNQTHYNTLIIYYGEMKNEAIRSIYDQKRQSLYRNFTPRRGETSEHILYFLLADEEAKLQHVMEELRDQPWASGIRVTYDRSQSHDNWLCIKLLPVESSQESMQRRLMARLGVEKRVTFGSRPGTCDVTIQDTDKDRMVKELKRRFEPVSLSGWKNIFRI